MATSRFNANIIEAANRLQDARTDALASGDTNMRFTSAQLQRYQNRAVKDLVRDTFLQLGRKGFAELMPELVRESGVLTLASNEVALPSDAWHFLDLRGTGTSPNNQSFTFVDDKDVSKIRAGRDLISPSSTRPVVFEKDGKLVTIGCGATATVQGRYIAIPDDIVAASTSGTVGTSYIVGTGSTVSSSRAVNDTTNSPFVAAHVGKILAALTRASNVARAIGRIQSIASTSQAILDEKAVFVSGTNAIDTLVIFDEFSSGDLTLADTWDGEIVKRMVEIALSEVKSSVSVG